MENIEKAAYQSLELSNNDTEEQTSMHYGNAVAVSSIHVSMDKLLALATPKHTSSEEKSPKNNQKNAMKREQIKEQIVQWSEKSAHNGTPQNPEHVGHCVQNTMYENTCTQSDDQISITSLTRELSDDARQLFDEALEVFDTGKQDKKVVTKEQITEIYNIFVNAKMSLATLIMIENVVEVLNEFKRLETDVLPGEDVVKLLDNDIPEERLEELLKKAYKKEKDQTKKLRLDRANWRIFD